MSDDTRPKLIHFLTQGLVDSRVQKGIFTKPYVESADVLFLQSMIFDMCGIMGTNCIDTPIPFFRVLSTREGLEEEAIKLAERAFNESVLPFGAEALGTIDLVFRNIRSRLNFEGDLGQYLNVFGKEKLPVEKARQSISMWGVKGGFTGIRHPDIIRRLIHWTYSSWEERGFPADQAGHIEDRLGENPMSVEEVSSNAVGALRDFCEQFYPNDLADLF